MTPENIQKHLDAISELSQYDMCSLWRFAPSGHPYFDASIPELFEAFQKRFKELGGFTPEISKALGWKP